MGITQDKFTEAIFSFILTEKCNFDCKYCFQKIDREDHLINFKLFKTVVDKILKEIVKVDLKYSVFYLMGGELSVLPETMKYIKYINDRINEINYQDDNHKIRIRLVTNYTGPKEYFQEYLSLDNTDPFFISKHYLFKNKDFLAKLHELPFSSYEIKIFYSTDTKLNNHKEIFDFCQEKNIPCIEEEIYAYTRNARDTGVVNKFKACKKCYALAYSIDNKGKIKEECKGHEYNFLNFRINKKPYNCTQICPPEYQERFFQEDL